MTLKINCILSWSLQFMLGRKWDTWRRKVNLSVHQITPAISSDQSFKIAIDDSYGVYYDHNVNNELFVFQRILAAE